MQMLRVVKARSLEIKRASFIISLGFIIDLSIVPIKRIYG